MTRAPSTIDEYLRRLPAADRAVLQRLRTTVRAAVPEPEEAVKTRVPAIRYRGKTVVGFGAGKRHLALYVMFGEALRALADDLAGYDVSNTVVRFTADTPLPTTLLKKIVAVRLREIETDVDR